MKTTLELSNTFSTQQKGIEKIQPILTLDANLTYLPNLGPLGVIGRDLISDCAISGHLVLKRQAIKCAGDYNKSQSFLTRPKSDMCAQ